VLLFLFLQLRGDRLPAKSSNLLIAAANLNLKRRWLKENKVTHGVWGPLLEVIAFYPCKSLWGFFWIKYSLLLL